MLFAMPGRGSHAEDAVALDFMKERGTPLDKQAFDWRDMVRVPISKLNDDAFTRVRIVLMNGIEQEANRFQHAAARMSKALRLPLARVRRVEHHQQTLINWLLPPDQSPLETTIAYEQVAIEVTASVAQHEPDLYLKQVYNFGMLEDFDHLYRFSALLDRVDGKDSNNILQSYTDIRPGRPTVVEHRAPEDDVRLSYDKLTAAPVSKLNALTILAAENQVRDYYMTIGPLFADPVARQLYAEIASIEEQHVTQYESLVDPDETLLEKWLIHEATELYNYYGCLVQETNPRIRDIWERFVSYELGHLHYVMDMFRAVERRDPAELLPAEMPDPIDFSSHRAYVRRVLETEVDLRASGTQIVPKDQESAASRAYRTIINASGSPSETVAAGYIWTPGTEVTKRAEAMDGSRQGAVVV